MHDFNRIQTSSSRRRAVRSRARASTPLARLASREFARRASSRGRRAPSSRRGVRHIAPRIQNLSRRRPCLPRCARTSVVLRRAHALWSVAHDPSRAGVAFACENTGAVARLRAVDVDEGVARGRATRAVRPRGARVRGVAVRRPRRRGVVRWRRRRCTDASGDGATRGTTTTTTTTTRTLSGDDDDERWTRACAVEGHESEVKSCAWSRSGSLLATCGRDRAVWVWERYGEEEFECAAALHGHAGDVKRVTWHPTEDVLVSVSYDESVRVWREDADGDDWTCAQVLGGEDGVARGGTRGDGLVREL